MQPGQIKVGDTVGIVTPARTVDPGLLLKGKAIIESWGLKVKLGDYALGGIGYLAARDEDRLDGPERRQRSRSQGPCRPRTYCRYIPARE